MPRGRQRQRQARRQQSGRRSGAPRRPPDAGDARREPEQVKGEEMVWCSNCDETHVLIYSCNGKLNEQWTTAPDKTSKSRLVKELGNHNIVQIACGDHHSMALSTGGHLFTWGLNSHGQLGVGSQDPLITKPQLVKGLQGIPIAQIAAGGAHSVVVSLSGAVYSWGKNDFGQLGLGHTEDRDCPSYVEALEHWKAVFISCGADHNAVLSKDGLVYTFGAGGAGQLGHNSTRNELTPRVVAELWGARVSQVACGRQHTLVYVPSLDQVYSFGSYQGQLERERKANQLVPLPINSPEDNGKFCQENTSQNMTETTTERKENIIDLLFKRRNSYPLNGIATLNRKEVNAWISNSSSQHWKTIKKVIGLVFSSEACINGSFLDKRGKHFRTSKEISGVDMTKVLQFYKKISKNAEVYQEVQKEINNLLPSLSSPVSPENFRVYLILPFLLQQQNSSSYSTLKLLAEAILRLQQKDLQTLECLWSNLEIDHFKNLVVIFRRVSLNSLTQLFCNHSVEYPQKIETLQILQILYQVNSRAGFKLQDNHFYIPEMKEVIHDFHVMGISLTVLIKYPCIFNMKHKLAIHLLECNRLSSFFNIHPVLNSLFHKQWIFPVRRECLLHDIWNHLRNANNSQFTHLLNVRFDGEEGQGEGLRLELFTVAAKALCHPQSGVFRHFPSRLVWFPRQASSHDDTFLLAGTLLGMAMYNHCQTPLPFPRVLFKKMRDVEPTLEDLEELIPAVGRNLKNILKEESEHKLESLQMTFVQMEEGGSVVELKKNGANILVTKHNRKEFVDLYVNYMLNESVRKPFEDFMRGFSRGCPAESWKMFLPDELMIFLLGHTNYDWHLLKKNVKYVHYKESHQTIKNFWSVFHKLPEEKKKKFLAFISGSDRIVPFGLEYFVFSIEDPLFEDPDNLYPSAQICSYTLFLPKYSSKEILEEKLLSAIEYNEGFGLR
ncbi:probable E3 ubiquitin-protein ligase HERC4 [Tympanuchus pallidicinctus]|uniref:probable E3 ubiquitin-protein ligase HERC4 n=1 Tax=Tympanuchus pallidicinctus TaxID=109042 RepID=UPI002286DFCD|nr:probable E3 ubiquitin-protein ligase HERC4 [Tympanuchus pallidicinctus]